MCFYNIINYKCLVYLEDNPALLPSPLNSYNEVIYKFNIRTHTHARTRTHTHTDD